VGKPSQNAAQLCAKAQVRVNDDLRADVLWKGWGFWVSTWNVDSLTCRAGQLVEALKDREVDAACIKKHDGEVVVVNSMFYKGKRYKAYWMGGELMV